MLRLFFAFLLLLIPILGVYTFVTADEHGWWFPSQVSTYGDAIDNLFNLIAWMVGITFVGTEVLLAWFIFKYAKRNDEGKGVCTHGSHRLEMIWTAVPATLLVIIAFAQMDTWKKMRFDSGFPDSPEAPYTKQKPIAVVWASQFDWRMQYPGPDGQLGTMDDFESAYDFVVPVDTDIVFTLRSRDVIHSFFVPNFRLKQDALPGQSIPVWFNAREVGEYDLICAELCGWGHYKMAGRVRVVSQEDYDAWNEAAVADWMSTGSEDDQ